MVKAKSHISYIQKQMISFSNQISSFAYCQVSYWSLRDSELSSSKCLYMQICCQDSFMLCQSTWHLELSGMTWATFRVRRALELSSFKESLVTKVNSQTLDLEERKQNWSAQHSLRVKYSSVLRSKRLDLGDCPSDKKLANMHNFQ